MADLEVVLADLLAEYDDLDSILAGLPDSDWTRATPADGWTIAHQIAHLAWTDRASLIAATDAAGFAALTEAAMRNPTGFVDEYAAVGAAQPPAELLQEWRTERTALVTALRAVPEGTKLPWYGPPMSPTSMATARLMETWAHGQDVADALHITRTPTARLKQVAFIGVRTRDFAYLLNNVPAPVEQFRVELSAPDGEVWSWGPPEASDRVTGSALDFCLLVTQRRHLDDLDVNATGAAAAHWLTFAQAFAGAPGPGRPPSAALSVEPAPDR